MAVLEPMGRSPNFPFPLTVSRAPVCGLSSFLTSHQLDVVSTERISRVCFDSMDLFSSLPLALARSLCAEEASVPVMVECHKACRGGGFRDPALRPVPSLPSLPIREPVGDGSFSSSFVTGAPGILNIECIAAGRINVTGARLASALESIFREHEVIVSLNADPVSEWRYFPFAVRCEASSVSFLVPAAQLDTSLPPPAGRSWSGVPRARLAVMASEMCSSPGSHFSWMAVRHPELLAAEAFIRVMACGFAGSWKSVLSGLRAWSACMSTFFPHSPHFPMCDASLTAFASLFQSQGTFRQYLAHVRKGEVILRQSTRVSPGVEKALVRGLRRASVSRVLFRLGASSTRLLIRCAVAHNDSESARLYSVAYTFMFRVANELIPIQQDGRLVATGSLDWHSVVRRTRAGSEVTLRTRKNAPNGAKVKRKCSCDIASPLLCGSCALLAQVRAARRAGVRPGGCIFTSSSSSLLRRFRAYCQELAFPRCGWHAFRRGAADDMVRAGTPLGTVLHAGGWRSGAFLSYISRESLDTHAALDAMLSLSDSE